MKIKQAAVWLDPLFAGVDWQQVHLDICAGIAKSETTYTSAGLDEVGQAAPNYTPSRVTDLRSKLSPEAQAVFDSLPAVDRPKFISFHAGVNTMPVVVIRAFDEFPKKYLAAHTWDTPNAKHFQPLIDMVKPHFSQVGRIIIFLSPVGYEARAHRDFEWVTNSEQFIWLNPSLRKKFYYLADGKKTYVKGHAAWFDTTVLHGSDRAEQATYSVRIDGVFSNLTRDFLNKSVVTP